MIYRRAIVATVLTVTFTARIALAGFAPGAGVAQPTLLRISGYVGGAPPDAKTLGAVTLGIDHTVVTFALRAVQSAGGELTEGRAALRQTELYNPNLLVVGPPALLQQISTAPPHAQLTIFGYLNGNSRRLMVVQVDTQ